MASLEPLYHVKGEILECELTLQLKKKTMKLLIIDPSKINFEHVHNDFPQRKCVHWINRDRSGKKLF